MVLGFVAHVHARTTWVVAACARTTGSLWEASLEAPVDMVPAVVLLKGRMPSVSLAGGSDDGGQWRQFDPGG